MGIEKRLEAASRLTGFPEDGPVVQDIARDALMAILTLKAKLRAAEALVEAGRTKDADQARACAETDDA